MSGRTAPRDSLVRGAVLAGGRGSAPRRCLSSTTARRPALASSATGRARASSPSPAGARRRPHLPALDVRVRRRRRGRAEQRSSARSTQLACGGDAHVAALRRGSAAIAGGGGRALVDWRVTDQNRCRGVARRRSARGGVASGANGAAAAETSAWAYAGYGRTARRWRRRSRRPDGEGYNRGGVDGGPARAPGDEAGRCTVARAHRAAPGRRGGRARRLGSSAGCRGGAAG